MITLMEACYWNCFTPKVLNEDNKEQHMETASRSYFIYKRISEQNILEIQNQFKHFDNMLYLQRLNYYTYLNLNLHYQIKWSLITQNFNTNIDQHTICTISYTHGTNY